MASARPVLLPSRSTVLATDDRAARTRSYPRSLLRSLDNYWRASEKAGHSVMEIVADERTTLRGSLCLYMYRWMRVYVHTHLYQTEWKTSSSLRKGDNRIFIREPHEMFRRGMDDDKSTDVPIMSDVFFGLLTINGNLFHEQRVLSRVRIGSIARCSG